MNALPEARSKPTTIRENNGTGNTNWGIQDSGLGTGNPEWGVGTWDSRVGIQLVNETVRLVRRKTEPGFRKT
jgi:hypothetical protein